MAIAITPADMLAIRHIGHKRHSYSAYAANMLSDIVALRTEDKAMPHAIGCYIH